VSTVTSITASTVVGWSDNNNPDNFFGTDVNEADTYTIPGQTTTSDTKPQIIGPMVFNKQLFIVCDHITYYSSYLGLPDVFSFDKFTDLSLLWFNLYATQTNGFTWYAEGSPKGVYILGYGRVYLFNGAVFSDITPKILGLGLVFYSIHYRSSTKEVWIRHGSARVLCYQEITGTWYERYCSFYSAGTNAISYIADNSFGTSSRRHLGLDGFGGTPIADAASGTSFGVPTLITQMISGGRLSTVKEVSDLYLAINQLGVTGTYATNANCVLLVKWYASDIGKIMGSPSTDANAKLISNNTNFLVTLPRVAFRSLALQIEITTLNTHPPGAITIQSIEPNISNLTPVVPTR
jgi:hypothetical protein